MQDGLHQVISQPPRAAGNQQSPAGQCGKFSSQIHAHGVHIFIQKLPQPYQPSVFFTYPIVPSTNSENELPSMERLRVARRRVALDTTEA
jgi:hypothetical protein